MLPDAYQLISDFQLWIVEGEDWSIPVLFGKARNQTNQETFDFVESALPVTALMHRALRYKLEPNQVEFRGVYWVMPNGWVAQNCKQAPGITAKLYINWKGERPEVKQHTLGKGVVPDSKLTTAWSNLHSDAESFLKHAWERSGVSSFEVFKAVWIALQKCAPDWIYDARKPLDIGFAKIVALPYRRNWLSIITYRFPQLLRVFRMKPEERKSAVPPEFWDHLRNTELTEYNHNEGTIHWTMEILPTAAWDNYVSRNEAMKRQVMSAGNYANHWARIVDMSRDTILAVVGYFILKTARPIAGVDRSGVGRVPLFVSQATGRTNHQTSHAAIPLRAICSDQTSITGPGDEDPLEETRAPMPALPVVQFNAEDVRGSWRNRDCGK